MASISIDQKRLKILTQQVSGKHKIILENKSDKTIVKPENLYIRKDSSAMINPLTETNYLKRDLIKIFMLVSLALLAQLSIYWSLSKGWLFSGMP